MARFINVSAQEKWWLRKEKQKKNRSTKQKQTKSFHILKYTLPSKKTLFPLSVLNNSKWSSISPLEIITWNIVKIQRYYQAPLKQNELLKSDIDTVMSWSLVCNWTGENFQSRNSSGCKSLMHWITDILSKQRNKSNSNWKEMIFFCACGEVGWISGHEFFSKPGRI